MTNLPLHLSPRPVRALVVRLAAPVGWLLAFALTLAVAGLLTAGFADTRAWLVGPEASVEVPSCGDYCGTDAGLLDTP